MVLILSTNNTTATTNVQATILAIAIRLIDATQKPIKGIAHVKMASHATTVMLLIE